MAERTADMFLGRSPLTAETQAIDGPAPTPVVAAAVALSPPDSYQTTG